jgi:AraC family transcriptional regulator, transcriptional activator of the genes for pyochelin and ferripyochelin receptors
LLCGLYSLSELAKPYRARRSDAPILVWPFVTRDQSMSANRISSRDCPIPNKDLIVSDHPFMGMSLDDLEPEIDRVLRDSDENNTSLDLTRGLKRRRWATKGIRLYLSEREGQGYMDLFKLSEHLVVTINDATYLRDTWVTVLGSGFFKIRILLSGELRAKSGATLLRGPGAMIHVSPGNSPTGLFICAGQTVQLLVLHCRPELLTDVLGLDASAIPAPLDRVLEPGPSTSASVGCGPESYHVARQILDSRDAMPGVLRMPYLEYSAMTILCEMLTALTNKQRLMRSSANLSTRDLNRIYEARDYLANHFATPPKIPALARLVGINQTKLKAGFREVTGQTIYDFILDRRMSRASELLLDGEHNVARVAYLVGYGYPGNFTYAFKKHFGRLPRSWREQR